ncbi:hypothetical protein PS1_028652 [Malus domestica]
MRNSGVNSNMPISFFILLFTVGLIINLGACQNECTESHCGNYGPPIRFPFRLKDKQPSHCGYPGFDLSCDRSNNTVLELPVSVTLSVTSINYKSQVIQVFDPDHCVPRYLQKLNLSSSAFVWDKI